mgnify:CR=1 FL=1
MDAVYNFIDQIVRLIVQPLIYLIMVTALVYLIWGVVFANLGDAEGRQKMRRHLFWGVIGFFIMVAIIAILTVVTATFDIPFPPKGPR